MRTVPLTMPRLMALARDVTREYRPDLEVVGVIPSVGARDSAEIVVMTSSGVATIGVLRGRSEAELRSALAEALSRYFDAA